MKERITLTALDAKPPVALRAIAEADLDDLRRWKNANREAFFFKGDITPEMQAQWYVEYLKRPRDAMFIVESGALRVGCMGFRLLEGMADCYNMMASPEGSGRGLMKAAMRLMCGYILDSHAGRIGSKALEGLPAMGWYLKCGFVPGAKQKGYTQMSLDRDRFVPLLYRVEP